MLKQWLNKRLHAKGVVHSEEKSPDAGSLDVVDQAERLIATGQKLEDDGRLDEAEAHYRQALELVPRYARAYLNIGNVYAERGNIEEAESQYRMALRSDPNSAGTYANLGRLYLERKNYEEALELFTRASELISGPSGVEALIGIGRSLEGMARDSQAIDVYRKALELAPGHEAANLNMWRLLTRLRRPDEAAHHLDRFLSISPSHAEGHGMLGKAYCDMGLLEPALKHMNLARDLDPDNAYWAGMRLFTLNYDSSYTAEMLFEQTRQYAQRFFSREYPDAPRFPNPPEPGRRLRIGYVSADFREHPVAAFVKPLFEHHDRSLFEIHTWYAGSAHDEVTDRFRRLSDGWHPIAGEEDASAFRRIREVGVDILIDLSGFTEGHRLSLFARKPAPIQATWLGYLGTTGMEVMDYRICDAFTDPPGMTEGLHTETLARLPHCQWCHAPYDDLPPVGIAPFDENGYLTFGSFNYVGKLNDEVLELWADLLKAVPGSHIRIAAVPDNKGQSHIVGSMVQRGISRERIEFIPRMKVEDYLAAITKVDIALDPFPYNGGTTSLDILMMGVPLITLAGKRSIARGGVSLLSNIGLTELIAESKEEYVDVARALAQNPERLGRLRAEIRGRMEQSILLDGSLFTRNLENLYRRWWRDWCGRSAT